MIGEAAMMLQAVAAQGAPAEAAAGPFAAASAVPDAAKPHDARSVVVRGQRAPAALSLRTAKAAHAPVGLSSRPFV